MAKNRTITVSFTERDGPLVEEYHRLLAEAQTQNPKVSKSEIAKAMMLQGMQASPTPRDGFDTTAIDDQLTEIREKVADLQHSLREVTDRSRKLRDDLATVTVVMLTEVADWSKDLAVAWIQENLREKAKG